MLTILKNGRYSNCLSIPCKYLSSVPLPDLHILSGNCQAKHDFLYPFRKPPSLEDGCQCSLAGQPKMLPTATLQLREDIIEKWNQKPERDIQKELVKHVFTY